MLAMRRTTQFKRDVKRLLRQGKDVEKLLRVVGDLAEGRELLPEYRDHPLRGAHADKRDCHIEPDWILIYTVDRDELVLYRTGSHSELYR